MSSLDSTVESSSAAKSSADSTDAAVSSQKPIGVEANVLEVLAEHDFDHLARKFQSATPYPWVCIDNFLKPDFAEILASSYPSYDDASNLGREFKAINETRKVQVVDANKYPAPVAKVHQLFSSDEWLDIVSNFTGIPNLLADPDMNGGGMHLYGSGALLDVHVDFNFVESRSWHRRLNILLFLNREWKSEWGGQFELWNADVSDRGGALDPVHNRCVLFQTNEISYHGVKKVVCPPQVTRNSFAAYYYTREAPEGWDGSTHTTRFIARPDEKLKRMLMPLERYIKWSQRKAQNIANKLK